MKWASRIAVGRSYDEAVDEVCDGLADALGGDAPDLLVVFAAPMLAPDLSELPARLLARLPGATLVGCTGGGVIGDGREVEGAAALSVTAAVLPDVRVKPFHLGSDRDDWPARIAVDPDDRSSFVLLPEPFSCDSQALLSWFDAAYPDSVKVGGIASGARQPGANALFLGERSFQSGAVGIALRGNIEVDTVVAQGCRPIGAPMFVTKSRRNVVLQLDGHPAVEVLQTLYATLPPKDQDLFRHSLFLGVVMRDHQQQYGHGDFLIRNLAGIEPESGALVVGAVLRDGQVVQFHLRDAQTSADDLQTLLRQRRDGDGARPEGALMFSCLGRGMHLYDRADHDTDMFREFYGAVPLGGFFCNGEIGPVQGNTFLHGYTSSFGLFFPRSD